MCLPLSIYKIRDHSMEPNFRERDFVLVNRWAWKFSVGNVVIAKHKKENFLVIKRIKKIAGKKVLLAGYAPQSVKPFWVNKKEIAGKVIFHIKWAK